MPFSTISTSFIVPSELTRTILVFFFPKELNDGISLHECVDGDVDIDFNERLSQAEVICKPHVAQPAGFSDLTASTG